MRRVLPLLLLFISIPASAERPMNVDDASVVRALSCNLDLWGDYISNEDAGAPRTEMTRAHADLQFGLTNRMEIGLNVPFGEIEITDEATNSGLMDPAIDLKILLLDEGLSAPAVAIRGRAKLDVGDEGENPPLGSGDEDYGVALIGSKHFAWGSLHIEAGFTAVGDGTFPREDEWSGGIAARFPLAPELEAGLEIYGNSNRVIGQDSVIEAAGHLVYSFRPDARLDIGIGAGISDDAPDITVTSGLGFSLF